MGLRTETSWDNLAPWNQPDAKGNVLGADVSKARTPKQILKAAGLDWSVEKRAMIDHETHKPIPNHFHLRRSSDMKSLDVVGNLYKPTQNEQVFEFFNDMGANIETAGSLAGGGIIWALAKLDAKITLPGRDTVQGYLFLGSPHIQGKSLIARMTALRDVCNNTISIALRKGKHGTGDTFRMNHRNEFDATQIKLAKEKLGLAKEQFIEFGETAKKLSKQKMTQNDAIRVLAPIFQPKTPVKEILSDIDANASAKLKDILDANRLAPGADPDTAWGVLNAVTYYADHMSSKTPDRRLQHAWLGRTANQKLDVLEALTTR